MQPSPLSRLAALDAARAVDGITLAEALRIIREARERRATFATYEAWRAYQADCYRGVKLNRALAEALSAVPHARRGVTATPLDPDAQEREAWRVDRVHYLAAHPEEVRTPLDAQLAAQPIA